MSRRLSVALSAGRTPQRSCRSSTEADDSRVKYRAKKIGTGMCRFELVSLKQARVRVPEHNKPALHRRHAAAVRGRLFVRAWKRDTVVGSPKCRPAKNDLSRDPASGSWSEW
ncbi:hypothetical protein N7447_010878 [Penicillium robsamsonii]|uniref:uncharacterized protein n=1 Tax=Penicillium robsamsonii TaxID=1792511 RepID=UPI00254922A2|nr:uncharacterized protein N7447_010878 [Penicillium robsamsonii]KAJ5807422.1 hypothetical protein N7447_010878 [Penicillium robsamsonii]